MLSFEQPQPNYAPVYGGYTTTTPYAYTGSYPTTPTYSDEQAISVISTTEAVSSGHASLESSGNSHLAPPTAEEEEGEEGDGEGLGKVFVRKTLPPKNVSLDSAYTSEADLDSSHNNTAANSGTASPKANKSCDLNAPPPSKGLHGGDSPILEKLKKLSLGENQSPDSTCPR